MSSCSRRIRVPAEPEYRGTRITLERPRAPARFAAALGAGRAGAAAADSAPVS